MCTAVPGCAIGRHRLRASLVCDARLQSTCQKGVFLCPKMQGSDVKSRQPRGPLALRWFPFPGNGSPSPVCAFGLLAPKGMAPKCWSRPPVVCSSATTVDPDSIQALPLGKGLHCHINTHRAPSQTPACPIFVDSDMNSHLADACHAKAMSAPTCSHLRQPVRLQHSSGQLCLGCFQPCLGSHSASCQPRFRSFQLGLLGTQLSLLGLLLLLCLQHRAEHNTFPAHQPLNFIILFSASQAFQRQAF